MEHLIVIALTLFCIMIKNFANQKERKTRKKPAYRVNSYLAKRKKKGRYRKDFKDMRANSKVFYENFHMDYDTFMELYRRLKPHLLPKRKTRSDLISAKQKLAVVLEFLASGTIGRHMAISGRFWGRWEVIGSSDSKYSTNSLKIM